MDTFTGVLVIKSSPTSKIIKDRFNNKIYMMIFSGCRIENLLSMYEIIRILDNKIILG